MVRYGSIEERGSSSESNPEANRSNVNFKVSPSQPHLPLISKITFYLFGVVSNIPWAAIILSLPYLLDRLTGSPLQPYLGSSVVIAFTVSGLIALVAATWFANKLQPTRILIITICLITLVLLVLATIPIWPISTLFVTVLVGTLAVSVTTSFFISSAVTVATAFGPDMVALYLSGLALVGLAGSASVFLLAYISNGGGVTDGRVGVIFTFSLSTAVSLFSLVTFILAVRDTETYQTKFGSPSRANSERDPLSEEQSHVVLDHDDGIWSTTRRNWGYNLAQCWLWIVTIAAFPAITTHVVPTSIQWSRLVFRAFHLLVFSAGDFVGRSFVSIYPTTKSSRRLLTYSALQTTLAPLFLLCNLDRSTAQPIPSSLFVVSSPPTPVIGDIGFLVLVFAFALTSGYAASLGFVAIGSGKGVHACSGARVLQLWMSIGFVLGSIASFGVGRWWM